MSNLRWKIAQAAEIRWWQGYLGKKSKTDYLEWKHQYWQQLLADIEVPIEPQDSILDAGCGPAGIFMIFNEHQVDAVDPLLGSYATKLNHFSPNEYPWVTFHEAPIEDYEPNQPFDKVFCLNAINHVADLAHSFDQLVKYTKPGGTLIVSIDAHNYWGFKKLFRLLPGDVLHPHQYDLEEYERMLTVRGCEIQKSLLYKKEFLFNYYILIAKVNKS